MYWVDVPFWLAVVAVELTNMRPHLAILAAGFSAFCCALMCEAKGCM